MLKNIVGDWGSELNDGDYACALAALGVLESTGSEQHRPSSEPAALVRALEKELVSGQRTGVWRGAYSLSMTIDSWRATAHKYPAALASAWRLYRSSIGHDRQIPRLGVALKWRTRPDLFAFNDLCDWLSHDAVGLNALVLADWQNGDTGAPWHWPLRVGVPVGPHEAWILDALRTAQGQRGWVEKLSRCYSVGGARDTCDVLILSMETAGEILAQPRTRIRARFVVCLENPSYHLEFLDICGELRDRVHAVGLAAVGGMDHLQINDWFTAVLRDVSHDLPIHAAVWGSGRRLLGRDPLVLGLPRALDGCRILALAERQDQLARLISFDRRVTRQRTIDPPESEPTFGGPGDESTKGVSPPFPESLKRPLADDLRNRMFTAEGVDGEGTARELSQREDDIERMRRSRWIQANAWRTGGSEAQARSLAPGQWNLLKVYIGPTQGQRLGAPFPEGSIDFRQGNVAITVQLELQGADLTTLADLNLPSEIFSNKSDLEHLMRWLNEKRPVTERSEPSTVPVGLASSEVTLPQVGDSSSALFGVYPHERVDQVEGRITIVHKNRILQTARLSIMTGDAPDKGTGVNVVAEAPIHPGLDDLDERREYDVAIQVSDIGRKLHLTIQHDGKATPVQLDDLSSPIAALRKALEEAAINWDYEKPMLEQVTFPENLYALAANGSALEQHLRNRCGDRIDGWERIHLVPATNEFLPLEYVYDGPPPRVDAKVCPNMLGALERESCDRALMTSTGITACPNQQDKAFVCPMHFWGFRKLIERSGTIHPAAAPGETPSTPICVPTKQPYGRVRGMVFAASDRAFLYENDPDERLVERASLVTELSKISGAVSDATDWDEWRREVTAKPNLLVLVVHSQKYRGASALEIGQERYLGYQEILPDLSGAGGQPQLLILLGCSTASVTENFQPYPERFRDAGVSIVLAPMATIRGADAVPIAKRIAQVLSDRLARPEPTTFGELLPLLRRDLLLRGHPGVMGIVGFGDGDWLLGGE